MSTRDPSSENPLPFVRERKIINSLLVICLMAGFACFALIILPDQISRANSGITSKMPELPPSLSAIVPLEQQEAESDSIIKVKRVARFDPEKLPTPPGHSEDYNEETDIPDIAGGSGAAIDEFSNEAMAPFEYHNEYAKRNTSPVRKEETDAWLGASTGLSDYETELKVHPKSSLALNAPSVLDSGMLSKKHEWLATPKGLEADVKFWSDIYTKYDRNKVVLHHPEYLDIIYEVVNLNDIDRDVRLTPVEKSYKREKKVNTRRDHITNILKKLAMTSKSSNLTSEEWRIKKLFTNLKEKSKFRKAAEDYGVRAQWGQSDKFTKGLQYSGRYLGEVESIIEDYGLPRELTRLIFVESMFNTKAKSKVGASGIWQFMPGTGRLYLRINELVDERNDPILATHAAAKLLRHNLNHLREWPLAINAYNAGRGRMQQAVKRLGTRDIGYIIKNFEHRAYGFASRNFFLEFLAALNIAEHYDDFFGEIEFDEPLRYEVVRSTYHLSLPNAARVAEIPMELMEELNPGFTAKVLSGKKLLPKGYSIRIPEGRGDIFLAAAARAPKSKIGPLKHVVKRRESLNSIAAMYGVLPSNIRKANKNIRRKPRRGQTIVIPFD